VRERIPILLAISESQFDPPAAIRGGYGLVVRVEPHSLNVLARYPPGYEIRSIRSDVGAATRIFMARRLL
jgi:hypothetical protein